MTYAVSRNPYGLVVVASGMRRDLAFVAAALALATSLLWLAAAPYPM